VICESGLVERFRVVANRCGSEGSLDIVGSIPSRGALDALHLGRLSPWYSTDNAAQQELRKLFHIFLQSSTRTKHVY
jgi:hypothetical protein